jgi:hypothetical protein
LSLNNVPTIWGLLDLGFFGWYVAGSLLGGRVPIYTDLRTATETAASFGNISPVVVTTLSCALYVSLPLSGALLFRKNRLGTILAYVQFPFRLAFVVPSLFFIPWLVRPFHHRIAVAVGIALIVGSEILKLWSLWLCRKHLLPNKALEATRP